MGLDSFSLQWSLTRVGRQETYRQTEYVDRWNKLFKFKFFSKDVVNVGVDEWMNKWMVKMEHDKWIFLKEGSYDVDRHQLYLFLLQTMYCSHFNSYQILKLFWQTSKLYMYH